MVELHTIAIARNYDEAVAVFYRVACREGLEPAGVYVWEVR